MFIGIVLILFSCTKKDDGIELSQVNIPEITGFHLRSDDGQSMGTIGVVNNKIQASGKSDGMDCEILLYPNPVLFYGGVRIEKPAIRQRIVVWVVVGRYNENIPYYYFDSNMMNMVAGGKAIFQREFYSDQAEVNVKFNDDLLHPGYYRVFVKIDDVLLYDNLIVAELKD